MILADKIINERKKNGWSQEELAEKLSVSRQSVSKWEGAQATPDLQKIIMLAEIFGVTTDYLLKDEMEEKPVLSPMVEESTSSRDVRKVSLEEASEFIELTKRTSPKIALGVSLCITSPVILLLLTGLSDFYELGISDFAASLIGVVTLICLIAIAVYIFMVYGSKLNKYEYLDLSDIETAYGVTGMVADKKKAFEDTHTSMTALGVILCILSPLPLIITAFLTNSDGIVTCMVAVLLILVAIAVNMFIRVGSIWDCYNKLLEEGDYTFEQKERRKVKNKFSGVYWTLVTAGYLAWSFTTTSWEITWVVWPIAGLLFAALCAGVDSFVKVNK